MRWPMNESNDVTLMLAENKSSRKCTSVTFSQISADFQSCFTATRNAQ